MGDRRVVRDAVTRARVALTALGRGVWIAAGVALALIAVIAAAGGFAPASRADAPLVPLRPGDVHQNDQIAVSFAGAAVTDDPELYLDEGNVAIVVELTVENLWDRPLSTMLDVFDATITAPGMPEDAELRVRRADDGGAQSELQPALPVALSATWEVPAGSVAPGDELRIVVGDPTLRQFAVLGDSWVWGRHVPAAEVTLVLEDGMGEAP